MKPLIDQLKEKGYIIVDDPLNPVYNKRWSIRYTKEMITKIMDNSIINHTKMRKIETLEKTVEDLRKQVYTLQNSVNEEVYRRETPPLYKYGDEVTSKEGAPLAKVLKSSIVKSTFPLIYQFRFGWEYEIDVIGRECITVSEGQLEEFIRKGKIKK